MTTKQAEWDALLAARTNHLQTAIDRLNSEKAVVDERCARCHGGANADANALCAEYDAQSARLANRIASNVTQKTAIEARLYASLSSEQKAVVDVVCTSGALHVQTALAHSSLDPVAVSSRVAAAKASLTNPSALTTDDEDKLWATVIQRMTQGL